MLFEDRYGRDACCCGKDCWQEFDWRLTLSILGKPYTPDPKRLVEEEAFARDADRRSVSDEVAENVRLTPRGTRHDECADATCPICSRRYEAEQQSMRDLVASGGIVDAP